MPPRAASRRLLCLVNLRHIEISESFSRSFGRIHQLIYWCHNVHLNFIRSPYKLPIYCSQDSVEKSPSPTLSRFRGKNNTHLWRIGMSTRERCHGVDQQMSDEQRGFFGDWWRATCLLLVTTEMTFVLRGVIRSQKELSWLFISEQNQDKVAFVKFCRTRVGTWKNERWWSTTQFAVAQRIRPLRSQVTGHVLKLVHKHIINWWFEQAGLSVWRLGVRFVQLDWVICSKRPSGSASVS